MIPYSELYGLREIRVPYPLTIEMWLPWSSSSHVAIYAVLSVLSILTSGV